VTPAQDVLATVAIATCWGAFALTWLVGALYNATRGPRQRTRSPYGPTVAVGAAILLVVFRVIPDADWQSLVVHALWASLLGLVILLGSTGLTLWARLTLGTMWSSAPMIKQEHELRSDGPYAITRHPIYTGMLGMFLGTSLLAGAGRWVLLFPVSLGLIEVKLHLEERLMTEAFPDDYPSYRRRVPQLVPGSRLLRRHHAADR